MKKNISFFVAAIVFSFMVLGNSHLAKASSGFVNSGPGVQKAVNELPLPSVHPVGDEAGWIFDDNTTKWWYRNADGTFKESGWAWLDGNKDGIAECYFFDKDGWLLTNVTTPDGYQVDSNGAWTSGGMTQTKVVDIPTQDDVLDIDGGSIEVGGLISNAEFNELCRYAYSKGFRYMPKGSGILTDKFYVSYFRPNPDNPTDHRAKHVMGLGAKYRGESWIEFTLWMTEGKNYLSYSAWFYKNKHSLGMGGRSGYELLGTHRKVYSVSEMKHIIDRLAEFKY